MLGDSTAAQCSHHLAFLDAACRVPSSLPLRRGPGDVGEAGTLYFLETEDVRCESLMDISGSGIVTGELEGRCVEATF